MDAEGWSKKVLSKRFGESSYDFCSALPKVTKKIYTEKYTPRSKDVLLACRLIIIIQA